MGAQRAYAHMWGALHAPFGVWPVPTSPCCMFLNARDTHALTQLLECTFSAVYGFEDTLIFEKIFLDS